MAVLYFGLLLQPGSPELLIFRVLVVGAAGGGGPKTRLVAVMTCFSFCGLPIQADRW